MSLLRYIDGKSSANVLEGYAESLGVDSVIKTNPEAVERETRQAAVEWLQKRVAFPEPMNPVITGDKGEEKNWFHFNRRSELDKEHANGVFLGGKMTSLTDDDEMIPREITSLCVDAIASMGKTLEWSGPHELSICFRVSHVVEKDTRVRGSHWHTDTACWTQVVLLNGDGQEWTGGDLNLHVHPSCTQRRPLGDQKVEDVRYEYRPGSAICFTNQETFDGKVLMHRVSNASPKDDDTPATRMVLVIFDGDLRKPLK
jgi:hypothetical protein